MRALIIFFMILRAVDLSPLRAETPLDINAFSKLIGFPPEYLIAEDATLEEQDANAMPLPAESVDSSDLIAKKDIWKAVRITSTIPNSFYPVTIIIAKEGSFLRRKARKNIEVLEKARGNGEIQTSLGPILTPDFLGGAFVGQLKIPPRGAIKNYPDNQMALISELRAEAKHIDIRVYTPLAFEKNQALVLVPGGADYFDIFSHNEDSHSTKLPDWKRIFTAVGELAIGAGWANSHGKGEAQPDSIPNRLISPTAEGWNGNWFLVSMGFLSLISILFLLQRRRAFRR